MKNSKKTSPKAFTMVELIVVIAVIGLLAAILLPTLTQLPIVVKEKKTRARLGNLASACRLYANDFNGAFPPSNSSDIDGCSLTGAELLAVFLTGYADDDDGNGVWDSGSSPHVDDGVDGWGWRFYARGQVYGDKYGVEDLPTGDAEERLPDNVGQADARVFVDAFENPILYYVCYVNDQGTPQTSDDVCSYNDTDNPDGLVRDGQSDPYMGTNLADALHYRRDFVLITAGANGEWAINDEDDDDSWNRTNTPPGGRRGYDDLHNLSGQ